MLNADRPKKCWVFRPGNLVRLSLSVLLCSFAAPARSQQVPIVQQEKSAATESSETQASTGAQQADRQAFGSIKGKIIDQTGVGIGGARIKLTHEGQSANQEALSGDGGEFFFADVALGAFQLTISSEGLASQEISGTVQPGEAHVIPPVMLVIATQVTEVRVGLTQVELAEVQIQDQEKQRVLGFIPNFYVSYVPNAAPLTPKQKFGLAWKSSVDPVTFLGVGALAGTYHATGRWSSYGQGVQGYTKRYGAAYADVFAGTFIGGAILPSVLKQDPRYFYRGRGSKRSRLLYALSSAFICKGDNGQWEPNYSNVGGNFAAGGLSYLYYPAGDRHGARLLLSTALVRLGETTIASVFQEFFVRKLTPNLPTRAPSEH
jgi:hypothetical protein